MCVRIDSRCVIFTLLQTNESADLSCLPSVASRLKQKAPDVYVDISDAAVHAVVEQNYSVVKITGRVVQRTSEFAPFADRGFLDNTVNRNLTQALRNILHNVCASVARPSSTRSARSSPNERISRSRTRVHRRP